MAGSSFVCGHLAASPQMVLKCQVMRTATLTLEDDVAAMLERAREAKGRSVEMVVNKALRSALSAFVPIDGRQDSGASAATARRPATFQTLVELVSRHDGIDKAFADDLEQIQRDQPRSGEGILYSFPISSARVRGRCRE